MSKAYSRLGELPRGRASMNITPGCLVLEGGALRGTYSVGVMDALMEADINLHATVGVSAGALNGISYVSGQIGRSARSPLTYRHDQRYFGLRAYLRNKSPFGFDFMFGELTYKLDPLDIERFMHPSRRFACVATNCRTGQPEFFEKGDSLADIFLATRASSTMPYISEMVDIKGQPYLDGGCSLKIPHRWALEQGFDRCVVVLTQPALYRKGPMPMAGAAARALKKYPALVESLLSRHQRYNRALSLVEASRRQGKAFVLRPPERLAVGRCEKDPEKLRAVWQMGYTLAGEQLEQLREFLQA